MAFNFTSANSQYLTTASTPVSAYPITLACWFRSNLAASTCAVSINAVTTTSRINIFILNTGAVNLGVASTGNATSVTTTTTSTANTWNHAVGVCTSSTSRTVYLNGGGDATNTTSVDISGFSQIAVGARHAGSWGGFYNGDIAEVGIWNAALTVAEIASLSKGFTPDQIRPQNLVFYAPLVRDLQDARGGLAITNNNSATVAIHPRIYT